MKAVSYSVSMINGRYINWIRKLITVSKFARRFPKLNVNRQRLTGESDDLCVEIAQKVRDSLAAIVGGARHSTNMPDKWKKYVEHLNNEKDLKVIAWIELDVSTTTLLGRAKFKISAKRNELRQRLTWLTSDVQILNTKNYNNELDGMEISLEDR